MFPRVTSAPIGAVTPTSAIFTDIHRMTGHQIQVCRPTMAFSREGPRPECQHAPTAVEIGVPRLGSSIGTGGANVIKRIMGMVIAAYAVNLVLSGISDWLHLPRL